MVRVSRNRSDFSISYRYAHS